MVFEKHPKARMRRLFGGDGRALVVAMDHLSKSGRGVRLRAPGRVLAEVAAAGADGVLLRPGPAIRHGGELAAMALILSLGADPAGHPEGLELALRLGADAVKIEAFPGSEISPPPLAALGPLAAGCQRWGMPLVAEMIPVSFEAREAHTPPNLIDAARLGADLGADVVKTRFTGDEESFAELAALAQVPVLILGGSRGEERSLFSDLRAALDAGAAGAAIGRQVWEHPRPGHMAGALARMIHEDLGVEAALAEASRTGVTPLPSVPERRQRDG